MHEIGIADAIIEASEAEAGRRPGSKLVKVGIRVGVLSGVNRDALSFALMALTQGTDLQLVAFVIQDCPRRNRCLTCGYEFESAIYNRPCPVCAAEESVLVGGNELDLAYVELEEP